MSDNNIIDNTADNTADNTSVDNTSSNARLENEKQGDTSVGDTSVGDTSVGDTSVGDTSVGDTVDNTRVDNSVDSVSSDASRNIDLNFKALRQAKKQAERERDEFAARLKALEENRVAAPVKDDLYLDEDDLSKTKKEIRELKNQWAAQQNQIKTQNIEQKLKAEFPDLEAIVNEDNIEVLKARDPSFAKIINRAPSDPDELYHRAVAAYTLIKKYGIYVKDDHKNDRKRVEKNMSKPRPASTASSSGSDGLAEFSQFTNLNSEDRRKAIFKLARERANS